MTSRHPERPMRNQLDQFAALIAEDLTVPAAGIRMGKTSSEANAYMQRIRKEMGDQAR